MKKWLWVLLPVSLAAIAFNVAGLRVGEKSETKLPLDSLLSGDSGGGGVNRLASLIQCDLEVVETVVAQCGLPSRPPAAIVERKTLIDLSRVVRIRPSDGIVRPSITFFFDEQKISDRGTGFSRKIVRCDGMAFEANERPNITFGLSVEKHELTKFVDFADLLDFCRIEGQ